MEEGRVEETVRFGATKQARFGTVPVRFGTILQESIVETPMILRLRMTSCTLPPWSSFGGLSQRPVVPFK